jgi:transposase
MMFVAGLEQLPTAQGGALPPRLKSEIKRELQRLKLVAEMIATLEAERNAIVEDEASTHVNAKKTGYRASDQRWVRFRQT